MDGCDGVGLGMSVIKAAENFARGLFSDRNPPVKLESVSSLEEMERIRREYSAALELVEFIQKDLLRNIDNKDLAPAQRVLERITDITDAISTGKWEKMAKNPKGRFKIFDSEEEAVFIAQALEIIGSAHNGYRNSWDTPTVMAETSNILAAEGLSDTSNIVAVGDLYLNRIAEGEERGPRL